MSGPTDDSFDDRRRRQEILLAEASDYVGARELYRWDDWIVLTRGNIYFVLAVFAIDDLKRLKLKDDPDCGAFVPLPSQEIVITKSRDCASFGEALKYASGQESIEGLIL